MARTSTALVCSPEGLTRFSRDASFVKYVCAVAMPPACFFRAEPFDVVSAVIAAGASASVGLSASCATTLARLGENHAEMTSGTLLSRDRRDFLAGVFGRAGCSGGGMSDCSCSLCWICGIFKVSSDAFAVSRSNEGCILDVGRGVKVNDRGSTVACSGLARESRASGLAAIGCDCVASSVLVLRLRGQGTAR